MSGRPSVRPIDAAASNDRRTTHRKAPANMAQQTTVTLTDDLDGGKAAETVTFGLDGRVYEIDLSKKNAAALRKALGEFTASARRVRAGTAGVKEARATPPTGSMPRRSGNGRRNRASRCPRAAGFLPTSSRSTRPPTAEIRHLRVDKRRLSSEFLRGTSIPDPDRCSGH